jgi:hypothetical protein
LKASRSREDFVHLEPDFDALVKNWVAVLQQNWQLEEAFAVWITSAAVWIRRA